MIFLIVEQTYSSCIPVGNVGLNYFKFWHSPTSGKKKGFYILVFKVIHITLARHRKRDYLV